MVTIRNYSARYPAFPALLVTAMLALAGPIAAAASADRIDRIERLLGEVRTELDSLKRESASESQAGLVGTTPAPVLGGLLSERERALARASQTDLRKEAAGYSFSPDLPLGMNLLYWADPWGVRFEGGAIITDQTRVAGLSVTGLYGIHRFSALDLLETHLYALAGAGFTWERVLWESNISEHWFSLPDKWIHAQLGVGTELTFFGLGGVRFAPETGLQASQYLSRHERSAGNTFGTVPESDFSLEPFFAFHMSFYFR
jgi:hypothetical protein